MKYIIYRVKKQRINVNKIPSTNDCKRREERERKKLLKRNKSNLTNNTESKMRHSGMKRNNKKKRTIHQNGNGQKFNINYYSKSHITLNGMFISCTIYSKRYKNC